MFGLYYAIVGMVSGIICSIVAKRIGKSQKDWYTVGQVIPILSVIVILLFGESKSDFSGESIAAKNTVVNI